MTEIISPATQKLLVCAQVPSLSARRFAQILELPDFVTSPLEALPESHLELQSFLPTQDALGKAQEATESQVQQAEEFGARILSVLDPEYPAQLAASPEHPLILYVRGDLSKLSKKSLSLAGCPVPTAHGRITAERIASHFAENGWSIVTGLVSGCEVAAHEALLRSGHYSAAILTHGLHTVSPKKHQEIADRIVEAGGAILSQFPFGQAPLPSNRPTRYKLQQGLTQGLILIQADARGHSVTGCRTFLRSNRWLAVAYPTAHDRSTHISCIDANMVLAEGTEEEKRALLKLEDSDRLDNLLILKSRDDYRLIDERPMTD